MTQGARTAASMPPTVPAEPAGGKRFVLATFGSWGDLHPYLALGLRLRQRGHQVTLATSSVHRAKVEGEGLRFHALRPDLPDDEGGRELVRKVMDPRTGTEEVIARLVIPHLREQYEDLTAAMREADFLVNHALIYSGPLVAGVLRKAWASTVLQPMLFTSVYDPPTPPTGPSWNFLYRLGRGFTGAVMRLIKGRMRRWVEPVDRLRAELGLPPGENPIFEGQFSPYLNLALFSALFGPPQPDWPARTVVTGFPFYDRFSAGTGMPKELERFLQDGPPPVVFTLGTSAVVIAEDFYLKSVEAARLLGRRAVLLVGPEGWNRLPDPLPEGVLACPYAPHSELFPRAAALVHQGGVGTTGQGLRSGRPSLVVGFAHDQPDNGMRVQRLGCGRVLVRSQYTARRAAAELRRLLEDPSYAARAAEVGERVRAEDGAAAACDALERCLRQAEG